MRMHLRDLLEAGAPIGDHPIGMVVRRMAHRLVDRARQRGASDIAGALPGGSGGRIAQHRSVAGEGELATGRPLRALEHDAADRLGEGGVARTVDDDLRDRALAHRVIARLVIYGCGRQSTARARLSSAPVDVERARAGLGRGEKGMGSIPGAGIVGGDDLKLDRLDFGQFGLRHHAM